MQERNQENTSTTQVKQHETLALKQGCHKKLLQRYYSALWLQQTNCYNRKINHQNLQVIHPKSALGLVDCRGKILATSYG